ncbi:MAG: KPN_02809 family neutral zinc metallopeptidase [Thermoanaerobaculia bacterium]
MRLDDRPESDQVEDERGGGGIGGRHVAGGGLGILVLAVVIGLLTGHNPLQILQLLTSPSASTSDSGPPAPTPTGQNAGTQGEEPGVEDPGKKFVRVVLADTEQTWTEIFREHERRYELPKLVLFDGSVDSGCGLTSAAVGPFYCPEDFKVYLDLSFFRELSQRFGAPGDFARAYVIAHEVGHHVQNELGIMARAGGGRHASIAIELQADCLAGVWGNRGDRKGLLEPGDVEAGLKAAAAVGDDALQKMATGRVQPESWTHGSSADRVASLQRGLSTGDPEACRMPGAAQPLFR